MPHHRPKTPHHPPAAPPVELDLSADAVAMLAALESFGDDTASPVVRRHRVEQLLPGAPWPTERVWKAFGELLYAGRIESIKYRGDVLMRLLQPWERELIRKQIAKGGEPAMVFA